MGWASVFLLGMVIFARWQGRIGQSLAGCLMDVVFGLLLMGLGLALLIVGGYVKVG